MFTHVMFGANDLERLGAFYDAVLTPLGLVRNIAEMGEDGGPAGICWSPPGRRWPQFWVQYPWNGGKATTGNGVQVSFAAPSQAAVDAAWRAAIENGGSDEGPPGLRLHYAPDYYGAYARDPEGNKICILHCDGLEEMRGR